MEGVHPPESYEGVGHTARLNIRLVAEQVGRPPVSTVLGLGVNLRRVGRQPVVKRPTSYVKFTQLQTCTKVLQ